VVEAAELGAPADVAAGLGGRHGDLVLDLRDEVALGQEVGYPERVGDVGRHQVQDDRLADGHHHPGRLAGDREVVATVVRPIDQLPRPREPDHVDAGHRLGVEVGDVQVGRHAEPEHHGNREDGGHRVIRPRP
jgi:hypothetical protein